MFAQGRQAVLRRSFTSLALVAAALLCNCQLDTRTLQVAASSGEGGRGGDDPTPSAGTGSIIGSAGDTSSVGGSTSSGGVTANGGSEAQATVDGCADLDNNEKADCTETLANNADFKEDVSGWLGDPETTLAWTPENALGDPPSGSMLVTSPNVIDPLGENLALRAAQQCLAVTATKLLLVYANALIEAGQDEGGHAEIDVFYFDEADCHGQARPGFSTPQPLQATRGSWLTLKAGGVLGAATKSALIKLAVVKPVRVGLFEARFDNVLVRLDQP